VHAFLVTSAIFRGTCECVPMRLPSTRMNGRAEPDCCVRVVAQHRDRTFTVYVFMMMDCVFYWKVRPTPVMPRSFWTKAAARRWEDGDTLLWNRLGATQRT